MRLNRVERILDKYGKETSMAVIQLQMDDNTLKEYRCEFPLYYVGMNLIYNKQEQWEIVDAPDLSEKTIEILRDNGKFFYEVKDILPFEYISHLCNSKANIYQMYKNNPFCLTTMYPYESNTPYISFPKLDAHFTATTWEERLNEYRYTIKYILNEVENKGHTFIYYNEFKKRFLQILRRNGHPMRVGEPSAILEYYHHEFYLEKPFHKYSKVAYVETRNKEMDILNAYLTTKDLSTLFPKYQPVIKEGFTAEQQIAIKESILSKGRISVLTGGPGTGKTTVIEEIVKGVQEEYPEIKIRIMAPTGKAANRIKEVMGTYDVEISTVHKFLGHGKEFMTKEDREHIRASGFIIIDETSMLDLNTFWELMDKIDIENCKLLLVGDVNQLPSIGAGNILHDMIHIGVPVYYLTLNHRSAKNIKKNADKIINGDFSLEEDDTFEIISKNSSVGWYFAGLDSLGINECSVISPFRKETIEGSAYAINQLVQNAKFKNMNKILDKFYIGDVVIFINTNYKKGYFNGEMGTIISYKNGVYTVKIGNDFIEVEDTKEIELGYSYSIHKSQGSENDTIIICIPKYSDFITRRMFYTAITRAKKKVKIYASYETIRKIILNNKDEERLTFLSIYKKE